MFTAELDFPGAMARGMKGKEIRRGQEHLMLHGQGLKLDGDFGKITEACVVEFQEEKLIPVSGLIDEATWDALVAPMRLAVNPLLMGGEGLALTFKRIVEAHLAAKPREVGGNNCGPWVRLYMNGHDNNENGDADWNWCAGSVTSMLLQAAAAMGEESPIPYAINCTRLGELGRKAGLFFQGEQAPEDAQIGIFLEEKENRQANDEKYRHTGAFLSVKGGVARTVEGNFGGGLKGRMAPYKRDLRLNDLIVLS